MVFDAPLESSDIPAEVPVFDNVEDVLRYLRSRGLGDLAGDLEYKKCLIEEDPDELPVSLDSAAGVRWFCLEGSCGKLSERGSGFLRVRRTGVDHTGPVCIQAWVSSGADSEE